MKYYTVLVILVVLLGSCATTQPPATEAAHPAPERQGPQVSDGESSDAGVPLRSRPSDPPQQDSHSSRPESESESEEGKVRSDEMSVTDHEQIRPDVTSGSEGQAASSRRAPEATPRSSEPEAERSERVASDQLPWTPPQSAFNGDKLTAGNPRLVSPKVPELPDGNDRIDSTIDRIISSMSTTELVGQLFMPAFVLNKDGLPLLQIDRETERTMRHVRPGGVLLFGQNLRDPEQARKLTADLQRLSEVPLLIAVDQEGGLVDRLGSSDEMRATRVPSASRVGSTKDRNLAYEVARVIGRELLTLGINTNFAPVADILTNPDNPVIGTRSFGSEPDSVSQMVAASVEGYNDVGVLSVLKHFPGHGDTREDSHYSTAVVDHEMDRLMSVELVPFARGIEAGAPAVMTAHISLPNVLENGTPATFSPRIVYDLLRNQLGFRGLVFTDSLTMGALIGHGPEELWPLIAFEAGADILVRPRNVEGSFQRLVDSVEEGAVAADRVKASVRRILRAKFHLGLMELPAPGDDTLFLKPATFYADQYALGAPEHRAIADEVWVRSSQE